MEMNTPNFLVIGAGKSGTTTLYEHLRNHPEVYMPGIKETNFFGLEGESIPDEDDDPEQRHHYPTAITRWDDYRALFQPRTPAHRAAGEVCPMYLYSSKAALGIKDRLPDVKLIVILRQPAERLYSRYMHLVRENRQPGSIEMALDENTIWWERNDLVREGFYYRHLTNYYQLFPSSQIMVFLYDDLKANTQQVMSELFAFIGVDPSHNVLSSEVHNPSGQIKNAFVDALIGQESLTKKWLSHISPELWKTIRDQPRLKRILIRLRRFNLEKIPLNPVLKKQLTLGIYNQDIRSLEQLLGRNLENWLTI